LASIVPRPDGLYDLELSPGVTIRALTADHLERAGHEVPAPSLSDPTRGALAFTGDTPQKEEPSATLSIGEGAFPPISDEELRRAAQTPVSPPAPREAPRPHAPPPDPKSFEALEKITGKGTGKPAPGKTVKVPDPLPAGDGGRTGPRYLVRKGGDTRTAFQRTPGVDVAETVERDLLGGDARAAARTAGFTDKEIEGAATVRPEAERALPGEVIDAYPELTTQFGSPELAELTSRKVASAMREEQQAREAAELRRLELVDREKARRVRIDADLSKMKDQVGARDRELAKLTPQSAQQIWSSKSTFQQIMGGISVALGGALMGLRGMSQNPGWEMLQDTLRQEVADQRAIYEAAERRGQQARNDYADALQLYGEPEAAMLDIENRRIAALERLVQSRADKVKTAEYIQQANQLVASLRQQRGENLMKIQALREGQIVEHWQNIPDQVIQLGGALKPEQRKRQLMFRGQRYFLAEDDATNKRHLRDALRAKDDLVRELGVLARMIQESSRVSPEFADEHKQKIASQAALVKFKTGQAAGTGALQEHEEKMLDDVTPSAQIVNYQAGKGVERPLTAIRIFERDIQNTLQNDLYVDPDATVPAAGATPPSTEYEGD
jgi:hypothetical protein